MTNRIISFLNRKLTKFWTWYCRKDLTRLALIFGTDKVHIHNYIVHYESFLKRFRNRKINLLEIGVGGYMNPNKGGESLRMWKHYFRRSVIHAIDLHDKSALQEERIKIFQGDQSDEAFLKTVIREMGEPDVIIDDGSHINEHVISSFQILFPFLKEGGIYFIEDTQTSYWKEYGGSTDLENKKTLGNFFKGLTDGLNYEEYLIPGYQPSYYDQWITGIHFFHNLIVIEKGRNNEGSNLVSNGQVSRKALKSIPERSTLIPFLSRKD